MKAAIVIMFIAMSAVPAADLCGKLLTSFHGASPTWVAWSRFAFGAVLTLPFGFRGSGRLFLDWRIWFRAALIACGILSIQTALSTEPLANVFAAFATKSRQRSRIAIFDWAES